MNSIYKSPFYAITLIHIPIPFYPENLHDDGAGFAHNVEGHGLVAGGGDAGGHSEVQELANGIAGAFEADIVASFGAAQENEVFGMPDFVNDVVPGVIPGTDGIDFPGYLDGILHAQSGELGGFQYIGVFFFKGDG